MTNWTCVRSVTATSWLTSGAVRAITTKGWSAVRPRHLCAVGRACGAAHQTGWGEAIALRLWRPAPHVTVRPVVVRGRTLRTAADAELAQLVVDVEALRTMIWGSAVRGPVHDRRADLHRRAVKVTGSRSMRERRDRHLLALAAPVVQGVSAEDVAAWASVEVRADERAAMLGALGPADPVRDRAELASADAAWSAAGTTAVRATVQDHLHAGTAALQQMARLRAAARATRTAALARALPHVPGWACTTLSAHHNFPLTAGLFDLLVIDLCRGRNYAEEVAGAVQKSVGRGALRCEGSAGIGIVAEGRLFSWGHRAPVREAKTVSGTRRKAGLLRPEVEGYRVWLGPSGLHPLVGPTHAQGSGSRRGLVVG